ncbi:D-alanyl-D-alanine carboxypeptidase family protein [Tateyamaria omphalii]|uniref:serine-type D-Ala-D-Ala carboxypeptidase n=1 Tax=Tateyamaria omphalii TaxID=299262 RepID=A0A1P8MRH4_9RHOB|nr:D-alanyl-D-alanine carboxypeptidase family protein [Tateyamaria omphalii]APX10658.1 D-alanyl-D-alanine carboxypeptidase [Tateyamaria omphalii]
MIRPLAAAALLIASTALPVTAFETRATAAYVIDHTTGTVLLNKNADEPLPPASMSKLMTLYMAFEAVERGQLSMTDELVVSAHANSFGGSTLFLKQGERVTVEDLIRGIIVLSGNDACVVIAEALSPDGTEAGFARLMTRRAQEMGMTNSTFANSSGWPAAGHRMSMRDLGLLSQRLITDYPEYYPMFSETEFLFDATESSNRFNRNPLLTLGIGADGLKTGHTQEAGYGLTGSAKQGDRRVVFVISGIDTVEARAQESEAIVNWAFRQFAERTVVEGGTRVATARVWEGAEPEVGLVPQEDVTVLLPILSGKTVNAEVVYTGPVQAPIAAGTTLGELVIQPEGLPEVRVPLLAEADIPHGGFLAKISTAALSLIERFNEETAPEGGA